MALFNLQQPFNQKRGRIHHEDISKPNERSDIKFFGKTIPDVQKKSGNEESYTSTSITAEADDFTTRKVNDPKNVLNRPIRNREHKKGYKYKEEKDGSLTLKGRRGNPLNQNDTIYKRNGNKISKLDFNSMIKSNQSTIKNTQKHNDSVSTRANEVGKMFPMESSSMDQIQMSRRLQKDINKGKKRLGEGVTPGSFTREVNGTEIDKRTFTVI